YVKLKYDYGAATFVTTFGFSKDAPRNHCGFSLLSTEKAQHRLEVGLNEDHPEIGRRIVVSLESAHRKLPEGIEVIPAKKFARMLWAGEIF
ncbi:MAG: hypothetical protein HY897_19570, partial [Deltaproteobacteria bacterium]|nr:hypothetical protein [Deltaproteobacteria bacterium]